MASQSIQAVVLAAGKSSRFNTGSSKLLEKICGREIILYATKLLEELSLPATVVLGHNAPEIRRVIEDFHAAQQPLFVYQNHQQGTGHALLASQEAWQYDHIIVLNSDMPLVTHDVIKQLIQKHLQSESSASFVIAHNDDPSLKGYGRVIKDSGGIKIVEAKNYHGNLNENCCVNAGIYIFKRGFLEKHITSLVPNSETKEYYITDLIEIASMHGNHVETISVNFDHVRGVNTLKELWAAEQIKKSELISYWMLRGIRFYAAQSVHLDLDISIGTGTSIGFGVHLFKGTHIGADCRIDAFSMITKSTIGDKVVVLPHSIIENSTIATESKIGPFAHIHSESSINTQSTIGNFVEIKKSSLGIKSKVKHLAYLGDTMAGNEVNIGAGTITCNHNGKTKHQTRIENNAYIGSNNTLIAPLTIGSNAFTAAGSVITKDVPADALAIARNFQVNKQGYALRLKSKSPQEITSNEQQPELSFLGALKTYNDIVNGN